MGRYTEKEDVPIEDFCSQRNNSVFVLMNEQLDYARSALFCKQINGQMFYPTDKQHLDELLSKFNQVVTVGCANRIWVPFVRSTRNATKWVFDRKFLPETEITFYPWKKMNLTQM